MIPDATPVVLSPEDRAMLEKLTRAATTEQRLAERARIVLLAGEGRSTRSIATELGTWPGKVSRWRQRFAAHGLAGLEDKHGKSEDGESSAPAPAGGGEISGDDIPF